MNRFSWIRAILSAIIGLAIGVIFTALVNLLKPWPDIMWALVAVCLASFFSALAGYFVGSLQKPKQGPAA
jgi:O-antigen/teichoic acid export membrane protein